MPLRRVILALFVLPLAACGPAGEQPAVPDDVALTFVGSDACAGCHEAAFSVWHDSHHALAMQEVTPEAVLGDFSGVEFRHFDETSTFFERDGKPWVRTADGGGQVRDFPIRYVFGVQPLQQYLVEFPGGRLQALSIAWDARPAVEGGQRWFHLYPDTPVEPGDPFHWTGREQNWNYMCAECHSTDLQKNYDADSDSYDTTWSELSVGCEACHGPGSRHVAQAGTGEFRNRAGLVADLDDAGRATWIMNPETGIAGRSEVRMRPPAQPEACGRCHARRSVSATEYTYGRPLMDTHTPSLLDERLYYADGQILEEVYVYGSFLQSRMYQAGVSCTDCHDPHGARLRTGDRPSDVCAGCHLPARFDATGHHRHPDGSVSCVDCHMTSRNFMVVDGRRDHSFRIPRPDLTVEAGTPNACNGCHEDRDAKWALAAVNEWYGEKPKDHYGFAIHAGRSGGGNQPLLAGITNGGFPGIVRGTLLTLLRPPYSQQVAAVMRDALRSADPFVRLGALRALPGLQPELQAEWAAPLLDDERRAVRIEAVTLLAPIRDLLHARYDGPYRAAEQELLDSIDAVSERPEAAINLGNHRLAAGDAALAEASFRRALALDPGSAAARANLADLYRQLSRDTDAEALLRDGLAMSPDEPSYHHALGLLLVRTDRAQEGLDALQRAAMLEPDNARYAYVYGVALNSLGRQDDAIDYLFAEREVFPGDFDVSWALATILRDAGRSEEARSVARSLSETYPGIPPLESLLQSL